MPRRSYRWVWALVGSCVLFAALVMGGAAWALTNGPETYGDDPALDRLRDARRLAGLWPRRYPVARHRLAARQ